MTILDWIGFEPAGALPRRVAFFNAGFLRQRRVRRILHLAGFDLRLIRPGAADLIAVWGHSPYAARGESIAAKTGAGLIRVEDAFLRSVHPGRAGEPPLGLVICRKGLHFDASKPSDLERILSEHPLDDSHLLNRARGCMARLREAGLTKYAGFDPDVTPPDPGYVLVIDQTKGDAAVRLGGADSNSFREMLYYAQEENPGARILIKTHPESQQGYRSGYFSEADATGRIQLYDQPVNPWSLLESAVAVYTVSSQLGFEAILAGHKPKVFGQPFYAGWGLTEDHRPPARRQRNLTRTQLFAGAMMLYPLWYDPCRDRLCRLEDALNGFEAQLRAWRDDRKGWDASGMRLWKRGALNGFFGGVKAVRFRDAPAENAARRQMVWAGKGEALNLDSLVRVEDGFLRSRGLGAALVPPLSLVCDDLGIYYDPNRESRLERLIAARASLRPDQDARADALRRRLIKAGLSKYNLGGTVPELPEGRRILVPGQVEDDASIRLGAGKVRTNLDLLRAARKANPNAVILYKPHPDVEAGLRPGAVLHTAALELADAVLDQADPVALLDRVSEVWTMTSLLGFEALLRGVEVTTFGAPFYAGWGLSRDLGPVPDRRRVRVGLNGLIHATLIDYPRYRDPVSGLPCPVEVIVERLASATADQGHGLKLLAKLQGALASWAHLWR
ncbi:Capsule polysaccharide biosynthesis protein [Thalassovita gelatinovora]|uniref:Capsule polysaccharide biosynthesis protein n=1 Tax=Thalassovita gelatinovora TaxID=53501 RepID=A0A0P1FBI4_THAGE|nr:capsular polysaccharide biosynthesis protein [Thalassovita gelatinovora]QIZ80105.1 capsular polysaccharide biosynthesis protein [Thalassovita gelatinovora]CUH65548.1 Capsule polysaccharide biosynthesis protein [Thalassovita gelatinovora]SER07845.1 capsular polysaccharide export protein [Thalassovita gelatinovora]